MPNFAEFFAGIGLVREAIEPLGWNCAFANDLSEQKAEMYRARFGSDDLYVSDVASLSVDDLPQDLDLVTASFPCIDLSLAGNRNGLDGRHSGVFWPFARLITEYCDRYAHPSAILIENVVGLASSNAGDDLARIVRWLNDLEYVCDIVQVDAKWFVPQSRPRLFVLALHSGESAIQTKDRAPVSRLRPPAVQRFLERHTDLHIGAITFSDPPRRTSKLLADVLEDVPYDSDLWWPTAQMDHLVSGMHQRHRDRVLDLSKSGPRAAGTIYRRVRGGRAVGEIRVDGIAGCLRTPVGGSSVQFVAQRIGDRIAIRRMTGREYARLQGVNDDFPINVPDRQAMHGFGDAVCVPAVRWLVSEAFGHLQQGSWTYERRISNQPRLLEKPESVTEGNGYRYPVTERRDTFTIAERSAIMRKIKSKDTEPEVTLRKALWARGLRYRLDADDLPGRPDIVFRSAKLAVFVDGEFWHGKKLSPERLAEMSEYWQKKIARNVERDSKTNSELIEAGWTVVRLGSHSVQKASDQAADIINAMVRGSMPKSIPDGVELLTSLR